jgi:hypothetical protein
VCLVKEVQIAGLVLKEAAQKKFSRRKIAERQIGLTGWNLPNEKTESRLNFLC